MSAAQARQAGFALPKRSVTKLVLAAWKAQNDGWMGEVLYDTAKTHGASDTVLSEAFAALEATARTISESGRGRLYDVQRDTPELMMRLCVEACAKLDGTSTISPST